MNRHDVLKLQPGDRVRVRPTHTPEHVLPAALVMDKLDRLNGVVTVISVRDEFRQDTVIVTRELGSFVFFPDEIVELVSSADAAQPGGDAEPDVTLEDGWSF